VKKERLSNIELLRIFAMIGVVVMHYNYAGLGNAFGNVTVGTTNFYTLYFLESVFICAVDVFMLISGYFTCHQKKLDLRKALHLLVQVMIFRVLIQFVITGSEFSLSLFIKTLIPKNYFAILYIAVYLLSSFINKLMTSLTIRSLNIFIFISFILLSVWPYAVDLLAALAGLNPDGLSTVAKDGNQSGYTLVNFILMYMIGAYLRLTNKRCKSYICLLALLGGWIILTVFSCTLRINNQSHSVVWEYCSPIVILCAISVFLLFNNIKIKSNKIINTVSKAAFAVYLLNPSLIERFVETEKYVAGNVFIMLLHIAATSILICLFSFVVQWVYDFITRPVFKLVDKKIEKYTVFEIE